MDLVTLKKQFVGPSTGYRRGELHALTRKRVKRDEESSGFCVSRYELCG